MNDRLFVGVFPTGISYADRGREKHGDYARCAFLNFRTLDLDIEPDCPRPLREEIERHARKIQARRGERFDTSSSGQYVILGRDASRRDSGRARAIREMKAVNRVMKGKHGTGKEWFKGVGTDTKKPRGLAGVMYSMARNAAEERGPGAEVHVALPKEKRAVQQLERDGLVTVRRTSDRISGYTEWYYKLTPRASGDRRRSRRGAHRMSADRDVRKRRPRPWWANRQWDVLAKTPQGWQRIYSTRLYNTALTDAKKWSAEMGQTTNIVEGEGHPNVRLRGNAPKIRKVITGRNG